MNPTLDNDLQKAIDDITKNTNSDPVFGDAVAAPEPVTPAPAPAPVSAKPSRPMPRMPHPFATHATAPVAPKPAPMPAPTPMPAPMPEPIAPAPLPPEPVMPKVSGPNKESETTTFDDLVETKAEVIEEPASKSANLEIPSDMRSVKEAALRDLAPILDKVDMDSSKKFGLYKDIHEELGDNSVIAPAYETAKTIADDKERADALLYLIDSIDNM